MRDPKVVLKHLSSLKENESVNNIYKNLYNPEFYKIAYQNIYSKPSQMTPASDKSTVDGMSEERINKIIQSLRNRSYSPTSLRRINIPKKSGGTRPISVPSFDDKLVQEIIRMLLEAIYEPMFSDCSHGFRPGKSCHTALNYTQCKFQGTKWWIDADIKGCFDNINHVVLLNKLKKKIREQKFIHLINLFLKAGYIENWKYNKTYSGTPQGSIISPILTNIYFHDFDKFMENMCNNFKCGTRRKMTPEYHSVANAIYKEKKKTNCSSEKLKDLVKRQKELTRNGKVSVYNDPNYKRMSYVRYADNFLIGVIASRKETELIMKRIYEYLLNELKLELHPEKTKIVHNTEKIRFLGYDITVYVSNTEKTRMNGGIHLWMPYEVCKNFILSNRFGKFVRDPLTGKPKLRGEARKELTNIDDLEILMQYNCKIRGLYNYYKMASNVCKMSRFNYICQLSFLRTLSNKYRTSCAKLYANKNYNHRLNGSAHLGVTYNEKFYELFNGPFVVVKNVVYDNKLDIIENINKYFLRTSLIQRMEAHICEVCGNTDGPFEIHHVRKLKDLKGKLAWEKIMISRRRKTMVLCITCHDKLHAGKL